MDRDKKVKYLNKFGYKSLNDEFLNELKIKDCRLYEDLVIATEKVNNKGEKAVLAIFFKNKFCLYTSKHLEKEVNEIIEGTRRLLIDLDIKSNETDFELIEK